MGLVAELASNAWETALAVLGVVLAVLVIFGFSAWSRWLSYREMMRLAETGGDLRVALQMRDRWRARHGMLYAGRLLALGLAIAVVLIFASGTETLGGHPVIGPHEMLLLIGAAALLVGFGTITLVAYAVWSRRDARLLDEARQQMPSAAGDAEEEGGG